MNPFLNKNYLITDGSTKLYGENPYRKYCAQQEISTPVTFQFQTTIAAAKRKNNHHQTNKQTKNIYILQKLLSYKNKNLYYQNFMHFKILKHNNHYCAT